MKKLASKLPIQQMIANAISSASEKLAEDNNAKDSKVQKLLAYEKKEHGHIPTPGEEEAEKLASATSEEWVEKLAAAVEFITENFESIEFPNKGILQKAAEEAGSPQGAGKGPGALEVSKAIGGEQSYKKDHSKTHDASKSEAGASLSGSHSGDGKTQMENDMHHAPGGGSVAPTARYPEKGPLVAGPTAKHASKQMTAKDIILAKLAGEDVLKANITAERSANPLAGMGQLESFDAEKAAPHQAGDHGEGFGNQARRLIASNQAAIDATKGDAKGPVKTQLGEVLDEPALTSSTDSKLEENLQNTGKAGVKIAAARGVLEKVAAEGCTCKTIDSECPYCNLKQKVAAAVQGKKDSTKVAMMGGMGAMAPSSTGGMGGGGMTPMADAGAGADGCTCGGIGECRVCKLKAALAAAKMQGGLMPGGAPQGMAGAAPGPAGEKDSGMGAGPMGGVC